MTSPTPLAAISPILENNILNTPRLPTNGRLPPLPSRLKSKQLKESKTDLSKIEYPAPPRTRSSSRRNRRRKNAEINKRMRQQSQCDVFDQDMSRQSLLLNEENVLCGFANTRRKRFGSKRRLRNRSLSLFSSGMPLTASEAGLSAFDIQREMPFWRLNYDVFRRLVVWPMPKDIVERHWKLSAAKELPFSRYPDHELQDYLVGCLTRSRAIVVKRAAEHAKRLAEINKEKNKIKINVSESEPTVDASHPLLLDMSSACVSHHTAKNTDELTEDDQEKTLNSVSSVSASLQLSKKDEASNEIPILSKHVSEIRVSSPQTKINHQLNVPNSSRAPAVSTSINVMSHVRAVSVDNACNYGSGGGGVSSSKLRGFTALGNDHTLDCRACRMPAYPAESVTVADGLLFHTACFRCSACSSLLPRATWNLRGKDFFCNPCHRRLALQTFRR